MAPLLLIKHAETFLIPEVTAEHWQLTDQGRAQCGPLAEVVRPYQVRQLVSSTEIKAIDTAKLVGRALGVPVDTELGLNEHDRSNVPLVPREQFERNMEKFFTQPRDLVYGTETADDACRRFRAAVERTVREYPVDAIQGSLGIVTHGTVMALLVARASGMDPFALWLQLASPAVMVVDPVLFTLRELIPHLPAGVGARARGE